MKVRKPIIAVTLSIVSVILFATYAFAHTVSMIKIDYKGLSDAKAIQKAYDYTTSRWKAEIISKMENPPVVINVIGRTTWTVREYCWPNWTQSFLHSGDFKTDDYYKKVKEVIKEPCTGDRFGRSFGKHDFHDDNLDRWRPTQATNYQLVP